MQTHGKRKSILKSISLYPLPSPSPISGKKRTEQTWAAGCRGPSRGGSSKYITKKNCEELPRILNCRPFTGNESKDLKTKLQEIKLFLKTASPQLKYVNLFSQTIDQKLSLASLIQVQGAPENFQKSHT